MKNFLKVLLIVVLLFVDYIFIKVMGTVGLDMSLFQILVITIINILVIYSILNNRKNKTVGPKVNFWVFIILSLILLFVGIFVWIGYGTACGLGGGCPNFNANVIRVIIIGLSIIIFISYIFDKIFRRKK